MKNAAHSQRALLALPNIFRRAARGARSWNCSMAAQPLLQMRSTSGLSIRRIDGAFTLFALIPRIY